MSSLVKGSRIQLIKVNLERVGLRDWMNEREPGVGDVVVVEDVFLKDKSFVVRLVCEPEAGFLVWRADIQDDGFEYVNV